MGSWAQNRLTILSVRLIKVNAPARPMLKVYFCTMKQQRSTIFLMLSSLLVLACFLGFWLRDAYQDAETTLSEKGNLLYQEAVRQVQDSVYREVIQVFVQRAENAKGAYTDSFPSSLGRVDVRIQTDSAHRPDSDERFPSTQKPRFRQLGLTVAADSAASSDTLIFIERLERFERFGRSQEDDHLEGEIQKRFKRALNKNELPTNYYVTQDSLQRDTSDLRFFPGDFNTYLSEEVVFQQAGSFLLRQISGQFLFSIFLFCLTALAFFTLLKSNRSALQYTQLKNDFMSNMTHELKTPITTIGLALEAMRNFITNRETDKASEYLQISQHELNRLSLLVDKVLKLSIFDNGVPTLKRETTDLHLLLKKVMDAMHIQMEQHGGQFHLETQGETFSLDADPVHLTNVIFNLLDNSLKYNEAPPQVDIKLEELPRHLRISIADNGIGIPKAYHEKVFERFFRVPATGNRHDVKGYGLGLSYVADIIEQHGGQIDLAANAPQGTRFIITLPKTYGNH